MASAQRLPRGVRIAAGFRREVEQATDECSGDDGRRVTRQDHHAVALGDPEREQDDADGGQGICERYQRQGCHQYQHRHHDRCTVQAVEPWRRRQCKQPRFDEVLEALGRARGPLEHVAHRVARQRVIEQAIRQPRHAIHNHRQTDQQHRRAECHAHGGNRHGQHERHAEDRAEHQQTLLADDFEQAPQRDSVAFNGGTRGAQRLGQADLRVAELDGGHGFARSGNPARRSIKGTGPRRRSRPHSQSERIYGAPGVRARCHRVHQLLRTARIAACRLKPTSSSAISSAPPAGYFTP